MYINISSARKIYYQAGELIDKIQHEIDYVKREIVTGELGWGQFPSIVLEITKNCLNGVRSIKLALYEALDSMGINPTSYETACYEDHRRTCRSRGMSNSEAQHFSELALRDYATFLRQNGSLLRGNRSLSDFCDLMDESIALLEKAYNLF